MFAPKEKSMLMLVCKKKKGICTTVCLFVCMYVCMYVCTYVRMYVCTYVRMYSICIHIYSQETKQKKKTLLLLGENALHLYTLTACNVDIPRQNNAARAADARDSHEQAKRDMHIPRVSRGIKTPRVHTGSMYICMRVCSSGYLPAASARQSYDPTTMRSKIPVNLSVVFNTPHAS
jgi:hypothetical protein